MKIKTCFLVSGLMASVGSILAAHAQQPTDMLICMSLSVMALGNIYREDR